MSPSVLVAAINAGGSVAIGIAALVLAYRRLNSTERRLEVAGQDLKPFYRELSGHDKRIQCLEENK